MADAKADLPSIDFLPIEKYASTFGTTLIVGVSRGLGFELAKSIASANGTLVYGTIRKDSIPQELVDARVQPIPNIELLDAGAPQRIVDALKDVQLDTLIISAGYFTTETLEKPNRAEEMKMMEICAVAPVMLITALHNAKKLKNPSRIGFITSEGGSIGLRSEKEGGLNYGHHASKAAANMVGRLLAWDLKPHGVSMVMIHPGFLRTKMTEDKYKHLWDELGAVTAHEAVPYILQAVADVTLETTGRFVAAMGKHGLGLGVWALEDPDKLVPGGQLPW